MKPGEWAGQGSSDPGAGLFVYGGVWSGLLALVLVSVLSWFFTRAMGPVGLIVMGAVFLAAISMLYVVIRYPVAVVMIWFLSMSGLGTLGMIRMPGIPDFSFPRLFLVVLMVMLPLGLILGRSLIRPPFAPDVLLLMHTFYVLINQQTLGNPHYFHSWYNSSMAPMVAYFFAKQYINEPRHVRTVVVSLILVTLYFWWISIFEHFGMKSLIWPKYITDLNVGKVWAGRSRGPFLQPALFGQILGMYLLVHLFFLTRKVGANWKILVGANLALGAVGLFFTYTRGGWLATVVGVGFLALLRPRFRKMVFVAGAFGILLGSIGLIQAADDEFLQERMENTGTIENRLGFLATATRMIQEKPLFGVGYFNYRGISHLYNRGTNIPFYGYVKRKLGADVAIHDIYLGRAAEEGLVSILLFFGFITVVGFQYMKRWREDPDDDWFDKDTLAVFAAMSVAYLVGGMVIDYRYFDLINVIPFFLTGIVVGYPSRRSATVAPYPGNHRT